MKTKDITNLVGKNKKVIAIVLALGIAGLLWMQYNEIKIPDNTCNRVTYQSGHSYGKTYLEKQSQDYISQVFLTELDDVLAFKKLQEDNMVSSNAVVRGGVDLICTSLCVQEEPYWYPINDYTFEMAVDYNCCCIWSIP